MIVILVGIGIIIILIYLITVGLATYADYQSLKVEKLRREQRHKQKIIEEVKRGDYEKKAKVLEEEVIWLNKETDEEYKRKKKLNIP